MSINPGDVVQLKTGGPKMTVGALLINNQVVCYWFDDHDVFQQQQIYLAALEPAKST